MPMIHRTCSEVSHIFRGHWNCSVSYVMPGHTGMQYVIKNILGCHLWKSVFYIAVWSTLSGDLNHLYVAIGTEHCPKTSMPPNVLLWMLSVWGIEHSSAFLCLTIFTSWSEHTFSIYVPCKNLSPPPPPWLWWPPIYPEPLQWSELQSDSL